MRKHLFATTSAAILALSATAFAASPELPKASETNPAAGAIKSDSRSSTPDPKMNRGERTQMQSPDRSRGAADMSGDKRSDDASYSSYRKNSASFSGNITGGYSAEELIGTNVKNAQGEDIGEVEDLLVGADNEVQKVILEVGGFLGIGSRTVAVDIEELTRNRGDNKHLVSSMSKDQLEALPEYKEANGTWMRHNRMKDK